MSRSVTLLVALILLTSVSAWGASYVVYDDRELIRRADAIVVASALGSHTQIASYGGVETVTAMSVEEVIKGPVRTGSLNVHEPGGVHGDRMMVIDGVPQFKAGDRVLLFLKRTPQGTWSAVDLALGKFSFETDRVGQKLLVRQEADIVGFGPDLKPHREQRRAAAKFLEFLRTEGAGGMGRQEYFVAYQPLVLRSQTEALTVETNAASTSAKSYTMASSDTNPNSSNGFRWASFPTALPYYYHGTGTHTTTAVNATNSAMTLWNGDCGSNVNVMNGGADTFGGTPQGALGSADGRNTIVWETDLTSLGIVAFSCNSSSYSGTIGIGGIEAATGPVTYAGEQFWNVTEGDVSMNQGVLGCTLLTGSGNFVKGVAHEIGHSLGLRHSDENRDGSACAATSTNECSTVAIMKALIANETAVTLQEWDVNAIRALYPTTCGVVPGDFDNDGKADLVWRNYATGDTALWFMNGTNIASTGGISSGTNPAWRVEGVGDFNADSKADLVWRNTATGENAIWLMNANVLQTGVFLTTVADQNWKIDGVGDFNSDGKSDIVWRNYLTGSVVIWQMNGTALDVGVGLNGAPLVTDPNWHIEGVGDFNNDNKSDLVWRNYSTGSVVVWLMDGVTLVQGVGISSVADPAWKIQAIGDFNNDGHDDLVWRQMVEGSGANVVWFLNGTTYAGSAGMFPVSSTSWEIGGPR